MRRIRGRPLWSRASSSWDGSVPVPQRRAAERARSSAHGRPIDVARTFLLDTGFLVALGDPRDRDHDRCVAVWSALRGRFATVEGVLVEAAHLVRRNSRGAETIIGLVSSVNAEVVAPSSRRYQRALELMDRYRNVPMDLVDALLVALAEERKLDAVLTLDRRGFLAYRIGGKRPFTVLP